MTEEQSTEYLARKRQGIRHDSSAARDYTPQKAPIPTEHEEQVAFVTWFRHNKNYRGVRIIAIPNGGARHPKTANDLKDEGVSPGVPDLFVPRWHLWIEMKRRTGGRLSEEQKDWIEYLSRSGYSCIVAYGAVDAIAKVKEFVGDLE
jgi:hypothetical protein